MQEGGPYCGLGFVTEQQEYGRDDHQQGRSIDTHAKPAESLDLDGLDDDKEESTHGTAKDGQRQPE